MFSRILGIDYGDVRTGMSITDPLGITVTPLEVLNISGDNNILINKILELKEKYGIKEVVIGYPKNMDGTKSKKSDQIDKVIIEIEKLNLIVHKQDERLTTVMAYNTMKELGIKQKEKNKHADRLASMYILENYLRCKGDK